MTRGLSSGLLFAVLVSLCSCSLTARQPSSTVPWPPRVDYITAACELTMDWDGTRHSGSMALTMVYPERFRLEVYGPFGETALFVEKNGERFLFKSGNDEIRDQKEFEARFGLRIATVMSDLSLRPRVEQGGLAFSTDVREGGDSMCWHGTPGRICMRFLEVHFSPP